MYVANTYLKDSRGRVEVEVDALECYYIRVLHLEHAHDHLQQAKHAIGERLGFALSCFAILVGTYASLNVRLVNFLGLNHWPDVSEGHEILEAEAIIPAFSPSLMAQPS